MTRCERAVPYSIPLLHIFFVSIGLSLHRSPASNFMSANSNFCAQVYFLTFWGWIKIFWRWNLISNFLRTRSKNLFTKFFMRSSLVSKFLFGAFKKWKFELSKKKVKILKKKKWKFVLTYFGEIPQDFLPEAPTSFN